MDWFEFWVDIGGLVGDACSFTGLEIPYGISEAFEIIGAGKDVYDAFIKQDLRDLSLDLVVYYTEKFVLDFLPDVVRLAPVVGYKGT